MATAPNKCKGNLKEGQMVFGIATRPIPTGPVGGTGAAAALASAAVGRAGYRPGLALCWLTSLASVD